MNFSLLHGKNRTSRAFGQLLDTLQQGINPLNRRVTWPQQRQSNGSNEGEGDVYWNPSVGIWSFHYTTTNFTDRHCIFFGTQDPTHQQTVSNCLEINIAKTGIYEGLGGVMLVDPSGNKYLAHTGRIGGGKKGVGKSKFLNWYGRDHLTTIEDGDRRRNVIVLGPVDDPLLPYCIAKYANDVVLFKSSEEARSTTRSITSFDSPYYDEFTGEVRYDQKSQAVAYFRHGLLVKALNEELTNRNLNLGKDRYRDLFILDEAQKPSHLFEFKTTDLPGDIYRAIGQLLVYEQLWERPVKKVAVLPSSLRKKLHKCLKALNIFVLRYTWSGDTPNFNAKDLKSALK